MGSELRQLVELKETAPRTVAATMNRVVEHYCDSGWIGPEEGQALRREAETLSACSETAVPVRDALLHSEFSPRQFMALMINTLVRVLPTYAEIPLNLAVHGAQGDLLNYGLITLNVNDEAGEGDPDRTHPTLFNRTAAALSKIFGVPALTIKIGRAALILKCNSDRYSNEDEALELLGSTLRQDELGQPQSQEQQRRAVAVALEYAPLLSEPAIRCYQERMAKFSELISRQFSGFGLDNAAYVELTALLAVREAAASDPQGIFHSLTEFVMRYAGHLGDDLHQVREALDWSDVHADEALGELAGYEGHSVEDDHAEQALGAVLDQIHNKDDLGIAVRAMNHLNELRMGLWQGTVAMMEAQDDSAVRPLRVSTSLYDQVCELRLQGAVPATLAAKSQEPVVSESTSIHLNPT